MQSNRDHKDRLFIRIFSDLDHKDWIISLVNALSGTSYTEDELVEVNTIEEILYIKMKNDVSHLINHQLFLVEHQSSYNPNKPLRGLIYFGQLYDSYIQQNNLNVYSSCRIRLPHPQFFVMYNGPKEVPDVSKLRLSDSFEQVAEAQYLPVQPEVEFEWTAAMYNINAGHNDTLLNACLPLQQYSQFVSMIHLGRLSGLTLDASLGQAVDYAIEHNFFDGLLRKLKGDVMSILFKEYTDEEANVLFYNDGHDAGYDKSFEDGVASQRAKYEAEIAQLKAEIDKLKGNTK